ncbi:tetratricopeptide repeat-containing protein [Salisediminibacterium selenitireducens]|uniref:Tetratricopeptide TPR_2 repeat protein n=1 Tax=Bacillus selenitireducens (strain ATCC 700615 / DSM 15326 / MLS10) TaxID=439292 RepID=D6XYB1_BACIE|nr:tetratricopeptide repeat-containing protein [Salisediminibacterium selenitireducens]ADI00180.1 Tetratricopeptide TPR_2 repeat protein [[Bacillus] selenitireducens MLS10]
MTENDLYEQEEALYAREEALLSYDPGEQGSAGYSPYIQLYKDFLKLYDRHPDFEAEREAVTMKLVHYLIEFGTYLKTTEQASPGPAITPLKQVLRYDRRNPLAHYRLGFLHYRKHAYHEAIHYFNRSLDFHSADSVIKWKLNSRQKQLASLYLTNSALHIQNSISEGEEDVIQGADGYPLAPAIDGLIRDMEFEIRSTDDVQTCSYEACQTFFETGGDRDDWLLFFDYQDTYLKHRGMIQTMHVDTARVLRSLFDAGGKPVKASDIADVYPEGARNNTYTQKISRIRQFVLRHFMKDDLIVSTDSVPGGTHDRHSVTYALNPNDKGIVLTRSDA